MEDHVHIRSRLGRTISQAEWVKELKHTSSIWIKERFPGIDDFACQAGYGVFSVSSDDIDVLTAYTTHQERHHHGTESTKGFQEEFRTLLRQHGEAWDERFVWE